MDTGVVEIQKPKEIEYDLKEVFERFLRLSVADGSASLRTIKAYREGIGVFMTWCKAAGIEPAGASFDHIHEYRKWLCERFKKSTSQARLAAVRVLYRSLQRWGKRKDNPAEGVKASSDRTSPTDKVLRKALTPDEVQMFMDVLPDDSMGICGDRNRAILLLMLFQGLREEEICRLDREDLEARAFEHLQVEGKGAKCRQLQLCGPVRAALAAWYQHLGPGTPEEPLFYRMEVEGHQRLGVRTIQRIADSYLSAAGLKQKGRSGHALRHTYGLLAVIGGAEREALAESFGHANLSTTDIYIRAAARLQGKPADAAASAALKTAPRPDKKDVETKETI